MSKSGATWIFTYDADGLRTKRTDGANTYLYYYEDGLLTRMKYNNFVFCFTYDSRGYPVSVTFNGNTYYYALNQQGDVMAILNASSAAVVNYNYNAWGELLSTTGSLANTIGLYNPLRYRGYVYDRETGLYYLQSRYYNPEICRFINADAYLSTGAGVVGFNMFAYCNNNPVSMYDPNGEIAITTLILIGSAVFGAACAAYTAYKEYQAGYEPVQIVGDSICAGMSGFCVVYSMGMTAYQCYQNYCYLNSITPVTSIGSSTTTSTTPVGPYANLIDPANVAPGKDFTASQKSQIIQQNRAMNGGVVRSDLSGIELVQPQKSMKGVTPSPFEWQIDHIIPKSAGGSNSFSNAQVLLRLENRIKWDH